MPSADVRIEARVSDALIPDLPIARRIEVDEADAIVRKFASSGSYQNIDVSHLAIVTGYLIIFDAAVTVRKVGQTDAGEDVNAGGFICSFDTNIDNSGDDALSVLYNGGGTLTIRGQVYGS